MLNHEIILAVVVVTSVFFILVAFCISYFMTYTQKRREHQQQLNATREQFSHQLLRAQIEVQEQTFAQIGKELHDNVGQLLSTARMLLGLTERSLHTPPDTLCIANETLAEAITQLRTLSKSLDSEWLERFQFSENLQHEINRINTSGTVHATCHPTHPIPLPPGQQIILFRIVQEAIQNALKHAQATHIRVSTTEHHQQLHICIHDNGSGRPTNAPTGMGLINMQHRTQLLGGSISWTTPPPSGTLVTIILPTTNNNI